MKNKWAFLVDVPVMIAAPFLIVMWFVSLGAILTGPADLFNKVTWAAGSTYAFAYAIRAMALHAAYGEARRAADRRKA